mmetsp:Transcript_29243/g.68392  ORF Transcript_29243/g.68392 Transcript_29243/m.68392 type:complete len:281 (+) Transcript_29243:704-1546(+)
MVQLLLVRKDGVDDLVHQVLENSVGNDVRKRPVYLEGEVDAINRIREELSVRKRVNAVLKGQVADVALPQHVDKAVINDPCVGKDHLDAVLNVPSAVRVRNQRIVVCARENPQLPHRRHDAVFYVAQITLVYVSVGAPEEPPPGLDQSPGEALEEEIGSGAVVANVDDADVGDRALEAVREVVRLVKSLDLDVDSEACCITYVPTRVLEKGLSVQQPPVVLVLTDLQSVKDQGTLHVGQDASLLPQVVVQMLEAPVLHIKQHSVHHPGVEVVLAARLGIG